MEPGSANRSWFTEEEICLNDANPVNDAVVKFSSMTQLQLDLGDTSVVSEPLAPHPVSSLVPVTEVAEVASSQSRTANVAPDLAEGQASLETELNQLRSLVEKQAVRIHNLEQALDQSLLSLEESRHQLINQQFLEAHLASTEEISNIQQQAIAQLKYQLTQQQSTLEAQQLQADEKNQAFQELLDVIEQMVQGHQTRVIKLRGQIHQGLISSDTHDHEASDIVSAQESADTATPLLTQYQTEILQLETELHRAHIALQEQQALIDGFQQVQTTRRTSGDSAGDELFAAQAKIQDLETQISKQVTTHALLQHACQELEQARDRYQNRTSELEHQLADLQEQVLQQAQQASEYETAIQHWKDRYTRSQQHLNRLKELVEQATPVLSEELANLIAQICTVTDVPEPESSTALVPHSPSVDLPDFLARRQRYRVRP